MHQKRFASIILKNPVVLLVSAALGFFIGIKYPSVSKILGNLGFLYIEGLKIIVFPLLLTVVTLSVANLVKHPQFKLIIGKILLWFSFASIFAAAFGVLLGVAGKPGHGFKDKYKSEISSIIDSNGVDENLKFKIEPELSESSLNNENAMILVIFSILLGVAIALIRHRKSDVLIEFFDSLSLAFYKIVDWGMLLLPLAVVCLMSRMSTGFDINHFKPMFRFLGLFCGGTLFLLIGGTIVIWLRSGQKLTIVIKGVIEPIVASFTTRSTLASIPFSMAIMSRDLKFNKETTNLFIPIGQSLGRFGNIIFFSFAAVFAAQFYSLDLNITSYFLIISGAIAAGFIGAGSSSIVTLSLLTLILSPLDIKVENILMLFLFIDPIIDPVRALLIVFINLVIASLIAKPKSCFDKDTVPGVLMQNLPDDINLRSYFSNFDGDIPIIGITKSEFLLNAFPKAKFKEYRKWEDLEKAWDNFDVNIVVGDREYIKKISKLSHTENKLVFLNRRH